MTKKLADGILCFTMPFPSMVPVRHAEKLVSRLAPNCKRLYVVGDKRIDLQNQPPHVIRYVEVATLHRTSDVQPLLWSRILWFIALIWIILRASWAVLMKRRHIDVVVCFLGVYYTPILLTARILGKKAITYEPTSSILQVSEAWQGKFGKEMLLAFLRWLRSLNRRLANLICVDSLYEIEQGDLQANIHKVRRVGSSIDLDLFNEHVPFSSRPNQVGFVGRLEIVKGVEEYLETAALMANEGVSFCIAGDGQLREMVKAAMQRPELSHMKYLGWLEERKFIEVLNSLRLFVLPSSAEGIPAAVMESMACCTPVLATAVGGIPDLIQHGLTGFILEDRSPHRIAQAIRQALAHPDLETIARQGRQYIQAEYSLEVTRHRWSEVFGELIA